jgi:hypothetical protein
MRQKYLSVITAFLILGTAGIFAESTVKKHACSVPSNYSQSELLIFEGKFESFQEVSSPHVLDQDRREMMRFECEDMPVLFYITPDAAFIRSFSPGQRLKIYGYQIGQWDAGYAMIVVQTVEEF